MARARSTASSWSTSSKERSCSSKGASRSTICAGYSKGLALKIRRAAATTQRCTRDGESQDNKENFHEACCERGSCDNPLREDRKRDKRSIQADAGEKES